MDPRRVVFRAAHLYCTLWIPRNSCGQLILRRSFHNLSGALGDILGAVSVRVHTLEQHFTVTVRPYDLWAYLSLVVLEDYELGWAYFRLVPHIPISEISGLISAAD